MTFATRSRHHPSPRERAEPDRSRSLVAGLARRVAGLLPPRLPAGWPDALDGAIRIAVNVMAAPLLRTRTNDWGATAAETAAPMPGDDLVPRPRMASTRAVSIAAPPEVVWSWLVQIGHGRGGLYSYDALENLVGCDLHSAERIYSGLQQLDPGELVRLGPDGYPCFRVASVDPGHSLVLIAADPKTHRVASPVGSGSGTSTWQWQLLATQGGAATRLIARQRYTFPARLSVPWHLIEPVDFVMERRMLLGLRERAERSTSPA